MSTANDRHPGEDLWRRYLGDELEEAERTALERHIDDCPECEGRREELTRLPPRLKDMVRGGAAQPPPPEVPGYAYVRGPNGWPVELGQGGLGVVYLARDPASRQVAIKFTLAGQGRTPAERLRFAREVEAVISLEHPGIVRCCDFGAAEGQMYYVMEFVEGQNLAEYQGRGPFPEAGTEEGSRAAARWALTLAEAIAHAHDHGIVHRDLKPGNVLARLDQGRLIGLKITDFGLARRLNTAPLTEAGRHVGTRPYMAPEQLRSGLPGLSPAVDVYGLGAILYFMLTGRPPFDPGLSDSELIAAVQRHDPVPPRQLNPRTPYHLETVCLKCLRKRPEDRYGSAAELAGDLRLVAAGRPPRARRQNRVERLTRWVRANPRAARVLAVISALLILLTISCALLAVKWGDAVRQQKKAETNATRARQNEARAAGLASARRLDAARVALGRGQLTVALPLFDQAVEAAPPDERPALEVERLRCLFAYGHWDRLAAELEGLAARADLPGPLRAQVLLHRGDLLSWELGPEKQQAARDLLRQALAVPQGLGLDDRSYALGLLEDSSLAAVRHFEEALRHDPFHLRANASLLAELTVTGRFEEARRRAEFLAVVFPDQPVTPLCLALMAKLEEDRTSFQRHLAGLRRVVADPGRMEGLERVFGTFDLMIQFNRRLHGPPPANPLARAWQKTGMVDFFTPQEALKLMRQGKVPLASEGVPDVVGVGMSVLARPARMLEGMNEAHEKLRKGQFAEAAAQLEQLGKDYPEALLRLMQAAAHLSLAARLAKQGDLPGCVREGQRAYELSEQAAEAPTVIPFGPYRHNAHWICLLVEIGWKAQYRTDAACLAAAALGTDPLAAAGALAAGQPRLALYPPRKDRRHLLRAVADSRGYLGVRADLFPALIGYFEPDDARLLLLDWVEDTPRNPEPVRLLARLERDQGNFRAALRWAEQALELAPQDKEMQAVRDFARARTGSHP